MVQWGTGVCGCILRKLQATICRFLPTQEWSSGGRKYAGRIWRQFADSPKYAPDSPSPTRPFLRRQESILYRAATPLVCRRNLFFYRATIFLFISLHYHSRISKYSLRAINYMKLIVPYCRPSFGRHKSCLR